MDPARYRRLEEIFEAAVECEGDERDVLLERECAGDAALRVEVELLLARDADEQSELPVGIPGLGTAGAGPALPRSGAAVPTTIGRYEVQHRIAEGGMGAVYLARQEHPEREVALKIIHPGLVTDELLQRFRFEAELLGRLQHPGIAQIFDAGEADTDAGRQPYFAMEYIKGSELRDYANEHELTVPERVELLARVCDAVNHAHQKGIVHRDLKPGNILVVEEPTSVTPVDPTRPVTTRFARLGQPKILDFGVSCMARDSRPDVTQLTRPGHVLGTPAYMSPEQAAGEELVDTRSDVYALGVIGFELLSGRLPHAIDHTPLMQALRIIQEDPAPRLESVASELRGDLSIVIGKALESERERRYASAAALAEDLRRYLADQPISARAPTIRYQLTRFVRRNKVFVACTLLAVLGLVTGLVLALRAQQEEAHQRRIAEQRTEDARRAAYSAQLKGAYAYRLSGELEAARGLLDAAPEDLRGWEWTYEAHSAEQDLSRLALEIGPGPRAIAWPNDNRILFPVGERTLRLYDFETGESVDLDYPGQEEIHSGSLVLVPGEQRALWGDPHGKLRFIDLSGGSLSPVLCDLGERITDARVTASGDRAVVLTLPLERPLTNTLQVVDLDSGEILCERRRMRYGYALAVNHEGTRIAYGARLEGEQAGGAAGVQVIDAQNLETLDEYVVHEGDVRRMCFSADDRLLASAGLELSIYVRDLVAGGEARFIGRPRSMIHSLTFHPDGKRLVSGHESAIIRVWDIESATCVQMSSGGLRPDPSDCGIIHLAFDERGEEVRALGGDGLRVRSLEPPLRAVFEHERGMYPYASDVVFGAHGRWFASSAWDGAVRVWDVATREPITVLDAPENVLWIELSPDGKHLLACSQLGYGTPAFRLWDTRTWMQVAELVDEGACYCGLYVPACDAVLLGFEDRVLVVDPRTLEARREWTTSSHARALALSPEGTRVALGLWGGEIQVYDAATLELVMELVGHEKDAGALAFSPDGTRLISGGANERICSWDPQTGELLARFDEPASGDMLDLCFTPSGDRILTASRRDSIGVRDAGSGEELLRLHGHESYVKSLAWSSDGRVLASASGDGTGRLWDARPLHERVAEKRRMLAAEERVRALVEELRIVHGDVVAMLTALDAVATFDQLEKYAAWVLVHRGPTR